ncbi:cysteine dioxygenase type I [Halopolyspora algeriensis]|uniref:Cysteine dioxygenase type I n=1 Tax=Halopolyspora algeriensis TaxID=1500506 RepID=A0A368VD87_9ACTN|nr:cysteine dioxygenase family protein [Halopolyspora algeriensis]RCW39159.1 cysteine dioxygenase type I [Halopolyspora algeriensis]TQM56544.1 cysteine dioxygenase type I [Halopolyspora algeriensis]
MFAVPANTVALPAHRAIAHPVRIARDLAGDRHTWAHLVRYDPDGRWFTVLERTDEHEAWLMSWLPGQHTDLHDHGGAAGGFTIVSGALSERAIRMDTAGRPVEALHSLVAGHSRAFGPNYVHQVRNDGPDPAISIHVYRPARAPMNVYTMDPVSGIVPDEST